MAQGDEDDPFRTPTPDSAGPRPADGWAQYPAQQQYPQYSQQSSQQQPGTDGLAIAGFVLSFLTVLGAVIGLIFSCIGLSRVRRSGQRGRGLAIAGIAISLAWFALAGALIAAHKVTFSSTVGTPATTSAVLKLRIGDCFEYTPGEDTQQLQNVAPYDCSLPHTAEVAGFSPVDATKWPGTAGFAPFSKSCTVLLYAYMDPDYLTAHRVQTAYFYPFQNAWDSGYHQLTCLLITSTDQNTSLKAPAGATATPGPADAALQSLQSAYSNAVKSEDTAVRDLPDPTAANTSLSQITTWVSQYLQASKTTRDLLAAVNWPADDQPAIDTLETDSRGETALLDQVETARTKDAATAAMIQWQRAANRSIYASLHIRALLGIPLPADATTPATPTT